MTPAEWFAARKAEAEQHATQDVTQDEFEAGVEVLDALILALVNEWG